jgi:HEAT repeat protein
MTKRSAKIHREGRQILEDFRSLGEAQIAELRKKAQSLSRVHEPALISAVAADLVSFDDISLRKAGCWLLIKLLENGAALCTEEISPLACGLADDSDWGVREESTYLFRELLRRDLPTSAHNYISLMAAGSENLRRAITVGAGRAGQKKRPELAKPLFDVLEPSVGDRREYVRKNLGPFAVGSYLIFHYPGEAFLRIKRWARSTDEQTRWTAVMSLSASGGVHFVDKALPIIKQCITDPSRYVSRAAHSALVKLAKHRDSVGSTVSVLQEWIAGSDPALRTAADSVLIRVGSKARIHNE